MSALDLTMPPDGSDLGKNPKVQNEFVHNSAYDPAQDEIDISAENAEKSDSTKYVLKDPKCNSPKLLLGEEIFYDKV